MATTNEDYLLTGNSVQSILLGTSSSIILQNTSSDLQLHYKIKDSASAGAVIKPNDIFQANYDVDVWYETSDSLKRRVYVVRN